MKNIPILRQTVFFLVSFILTIPSILNGQYDVTVSEWNAINARVYRVTSNSEDSGYPQFRNLDPDRTFFSNSGKWESYIRPNIKKFIKDFNTSAASIDKDMTALVTIADNWSVSTGSDQEKFKNQFKSKLSISKQKVSLLDKSITDLYNIIRDFNKINVDFDYQFNTKYKDVKISPSISESANAIAKVLGVNQAIQSDFASLLSSLNGLENIDPLLVDISALSVQKMWQNIKIGIKGYGKNIEGDGWDVNYVKYLNGSFTQLNDKQWVEKNDNTFYFEEYNRDVWSIYLYDKRRKKYIVLDQWKKKILIKRSGEREYTTLYAIESTRSKMNGKLLEGVTFYVSGKPTRQIVKVGNKWFESNINSTGGKFQFVERQRDDWSVYLWDTSRNVELALDMHRMKITYSDPNTPKRDQYNIAYGF